jgi:hypothetical protein
MKPEIQQAIQARLRPRLKRLNLTLDDTLEEYRRLAFAHLGPSCEDVDGELLPLDEWPKDHAQNALQLLSLKRQALSDVLKYLRHAGIYGQPRETRERHDDQ